jgi:hypothetical protein
VIGLILPDAEATKESRADRRYRDAAMRCRLATVNQLKQLVLDGGRFR